MRTVANPEVMRALLATLQAVRPESRRRWGTLSPHEMLCRLGDATAMVLRTRPRERLGDGHGSVADIFLPVWLADRIFPICGTTYAVALLIILVRVFR